MSSNPQPHRPILQPSSRSRTSRTEAGSSSYAQTHDRPTSKQQYQTSTTTLEKEVTYEETQRAYRAANMLESNELLIWHAMERNESIPQTKLHFERDMVALSSSDESIEWNEITSQDPADERRLRPGTIFTKDGWSHPDDVRDSGKKAEKRHMSSGAERMVSPLMRESTPESGKKRKGKMGKRRSGGGGGNARRSSEGGLF